MLVVDLVAVWLIYVMQSMYVSMKPYYENKRNKVSINDSVEQDVDK
jgi:hypothetical protein